jgi:hypothetical protein
MKMVGRGCPELSHVCVIDCPKLTDQSLKALGSCKGIRVLNVADCVRYGWKQCIYAVLGWFVNDDE